MTWRPDFILVVTALGLAVLAWAVIDTLAEGEAPLRMPWSVIR